jgi:cell division septum initiation protein DivIVA
LADHDVREFCRAGGFGAVQPNRQKETLRSPALRTCVNCQFRKAVPPLFPNVNNLNLRPNARDFKFDRELNGYKKQDVDGKLNELFRQIDDLTAQNNSLNDAIGQFDAEIRALTESARALEQERIHENMRLAGVMTTAGKTAEETVAKARWQAEQIIANARLEGQKALEAALREASDVKRQAAADAAAVREALNSLNRTLLTTRQATEQYFTSISAVLGGALYTPPDIPAPKPSSAYTPAPAPVLDAPLEYSPAHTFKPEPPPYTPTEAAAPETQQDSVADQYEDFLKSMGLTPDDMLQTPGDCIGHFGS